MSLMILDEVPPKVAHQLMMRIYEYMQKENRVPTPNSIMYSSEIFDENFSHAIQWLTSRELIYKNSNHETNPGAIYPATGGRIIVEDNGSGMTDDEVRSGWLTISKNNYNMLQNV